MRRRGRRGPPGKSGGGEWVFGASNGGSALAKRYLSPFDTQSGVLTPENAFLNPSARNAVEIEYYADSPGATVSSGTVTYALEINGVAALSVTTSITAQTGSATGSVAIPKGAKVAGTITHAGSVSAGQTRPKMIVRFA